MTPMQEQYNEIKAKYQNDIVLFRLGDFYEAFNEDAEIASKVLGITLTARGKDENRIPMAGIPYHALETYLPKIIESNYKVVLVEQLEEPKPGQIVKRGVTKIITPGTYISKEIKSENNYICRISIGKTIHSSLVDISTGELVYWNSNNIQELSNRLSTYKISEVVIDSKEQTLIENLNTQNYYISTEKVSINQTLIKNIFGTDHLKQFGIEKDSEEEKNILELLSYINECFREGLSQITNIKIQNWHNYVNLDANTIRNLELIYPQSGQDKKSTVFNNINSTKTNMGKRTLFNWLLHPSTSKVEIENRYNSVESFLNSYTRTVELNELLKTFNDLEKLAAKIGIKSINPKELVAIKSDLTQLKNINNLLGNINSELFKAVKTELSTPIIQKIIDTIAMYINENPSLEMGSGQVIMLGINQELDKVRNLAIGGQNELDGILAREVETTGISSLKIGNNKVFGYYLEVTNTHKSKVPANYVRKQTLTNAERYITEELKELEDRIYMAQNDLYNLELKIFLEVIDLLIPHINTIQSIAKVIGDLDVLASFADMARKKNYCKPEIKDDKVLSTIDSRHLVVENLQEEFTPNTLNADETYNFFIITGPNMSGKSTFIRQIALNNLLAQIGSYVPAKTFEYSIKDQIFTRVGASDKLAAGESTFMVEMLETAKILNSATEDSLIILDEIGRGTSTFDGLSLAWSISEFISDEIKAITLFATHYHELTDLKNDYSNIANLKVLVQEKEKDIQFTHKIVAGSVDQSYGIYVAKLAGIPEKVIKSAEEKLQILEKAPSKSKTKRERQENKIEQLSLLP